MKMKMTNRARCKGYVCPSAASYSLLRILLTFFCTKNPEPFSSSPWWILFLFSFTRIGILVYQGPKRIGISTRQRNFMFNTFSFESSHAREKVSSTIAYYFFEKICRFYQKMRKKNSRNIYHVQYVETTVIAAIMHSDTPCSVQDRLAQEWHVVH